MKVQVNAKLNLTLNILGAADGFHNIDSLATSIDVFDVVEVTLRSDKQVTVQGLPNVEDSRNTAYRAASAFVEQFDSNGADITIDKRIPLGAGLGGSSADAAAAMYCMCKLYGCDVASAKVRDICKAIGSDVNFMLRGGLGRLRGKGDDVEYFHLGKPLYFALTTFDCSVLSGDAYAQFDKIGAKCAHVDNGALLDMLRDGNFKNVSEHFNNQLQAAVRSLNGYADGYLRLCNKRGIKSNMTGSGSAYYAAFGDEQSAMDTAVLLNAHGFKTVVCQSVDNGVLFN